MHPPDEFLKHAAECEHMARRARKAEDRASWKHLAERWLRCADHFTQQSLAAHSNAKRPRNATLRWQSIPTN